MQINDLASPRKPDISETKGKRVSDDKTPKLLPCPFCGGAEVFTSIYGRHAKKWGILCNGCDAWLEGYDSETAAATAWNRRALPAVKVGVRHLVWEDSSARHRIIIETKSSAGVYRITQRYFPEEMFTLEKPNGDAVNLPTIDAAKAAAQADYAARILAAIQTG